MKHIKVFEKFISHREIELICSEYGIENYTINDDLSIDVAGSVNLSGKGLTELPLRFRRVSIKFDCSHNNLTSLKGCPDSEIYNFNCSHNKLTSLEFCPKNFKWDFECSYNNLTSLEYLPSVENGSYFLRNNNIKKLENLPSVVKILDLQSNEITSLEGCPLEINGFFDCSNNKLTNLEHIATTLKTNVYLGNNELQNIIGLPNKINGSLSLENNNLTSLEGCPGEILDRFVLTNNPDLITFENFPTLIGGDIHLSEKLKEVYFFLNGMRYPREDNINLNLIEYFNEIGAIKMKNSIPSISFKYFERFVDENEINFSEELFRKHLSNYYNIV